MRLVRTSLATPIFTVDLLLFLESKSFRTSGYEGILSESRRCPFALDGIVLAISSCVLEHLEFQQRVRRDLVTVTENLF